MAAYNFLGQHSHSLDTKKRVAIPAKYRQQLPEGQVFITTLPEGCLAVYPQSEWDSLVNENLGKLDPLSRSDRRMKRSLTSSADACVPDKQGRITISSKQKKRAGIKKEVVFVGSINSFEVWSKEKWAAEEASADEEEE
jgi:MraZ protein